jgi:hypothetical protein
MKMVRLIIAAMFFCFAGTAQAQLTKEQLKQRKELKNQTKDELDEKATKAASKEAKSLKKQGWMAAPGALPIEKQLDRSYRMQSEYDEEMFPMYIQGEGISTGQNYDAAKMQAMEMARQQLAGQIQTEMTALIESNVSNNQLEAGEAASVSKTIMAAKALISKSLGRTIPIMEVYRDLKNGNKEVLVRVAYSSKTAKAAVKKAVQEDLEKEGSNLQNKLDELLGW